ncbi:MAG TPA: FtsQ-type POTRA domain-containing protein [Gemmatimonadales bacterium]|nr:FtsQ-type POTRA domain-containing protein [Gemmatimonadales bacterium]
MSRRWIALGGVFAAAALWFALPALGRRMEFFRVRRVEFVGMRHLAPATALEALELPRSLTVFDDLEPIERRARSIPGITGVTVRRRLPGTLVVELTELPPVALIHRRGRLVLMDSAGRVLPFDPRRAAPDLPVADGPDSVVAGLLRRAQVQNTALFAGIESAARAGKDVVLMMGGRRVLLRADASFEEMRALKAVAEDLARKGVAYRELDGRFRGYVVVRGRGA